MDKYKAIIFDFDGTLVDSAPGIMRSLEIMLERLGKKPLSDDELRSCVGPPIHKFFPEFLGIRGDDMEHAIALFRQIFDEVALPSLKLFDGVIELLRDIKKSGRLIGIATCKLKNVCEAQVGSLGIAEYIDFVSGAQPQIGLCEKADIIKEALRVLKLSPNEALMVGDRIYDLIGANEAGLDSVGIMLGGCDTKEELSKHNPKAIVDDAAQLYEYILG